MKSFNTNSPSRGAEKVFFHQARSQGWIWLGLIAVYALIMMFGLWYGRYPHLLARSFAQGSRLLLLDEATSSLDIRRKIEVFDLLLQENNQNNRTVLSVLHDINLASMYLNRLIFLKKGRLVAEGKTEEVLTPEILGDVYETRVLVENHPVTGRPFILFLTGNS